MTDESTDEPPTPGVPERPFVSGWALYLLRTGGGLGAGGAWGYFLPLLLTVTGFDPLAWEQRRQFHVEVQMIWAVAGACIGTALAHYEAEHRQDASRKRIRVAAEEHVREVFRDRPVSGSKLWPEEGGCYRVAVFQADAGTSAGPIVVRVDKKSGTATLETDPLRPTSQA